MPFFVPALFYWFRFRAVLLSDSIFLTLHSLNVLAFLPLCFYCFALPAWLLLLCFTRLAFTARLLLLGFSSLDLTNSGFFTVPNNPSQPLSRHSDHKITAHGLLANSLMLADYCLCVQYNLHSLKRTETWPRQV